MLQRLARHLRKRLGVKQPHRPTEVPLAQRRGYETIHDDDAMTVLAVRGRDDSCLISFTGIGHALGGIDLQNPEFTRSGDEGTQLFIIDKCRTWGNGLDWDKLESIVKPLTRDARVTTLGNSMGGFLAILAARRFGAHQAIAFAPQWSVDPRIVPDEPRWKAYRDAIGTFRFPDLSESFGGTAHVTALFGTGPAEAVQLRHFATVDDGLTLLVLKRGGHDVARHLKEAGLLYPLIDVCRDGGDPAAFLLKSGVKLTDKAAIRRTYSSAGRVRY